MMGGSREKARAIMEGGDDRPITLGGEPLQVRERVIIRGAECPARAKVDGGAQQVGHGHDPALQQNQCVRYRRRRPLSGSFYRNHDPPIMAVMKSSPYPGYAEICIDRAISLHMALFILCQKF